MIWSLLRESSFRIWDRHGGQVRDLASFSETATRLALSADGRTIATAHDDGAVRLWERRTGTCGG